MENNITVNMENLSEKEREQLMKLIQKSNGSKGKVWKPDYRRKYFYINECGGIMNSKWYDDSIDADRYEIGNCFQTKEAADFALEKLKVEAELRRFAEENNEYEIDWENRNQNKWFIYYNYVMKNIGVVYDTVLRTHCIYFSSKEIAEQAIQVIGVDRLKKYFLGTED